MERATEDVDICKYAWQTMMNQLNDKLHVDRSGTGQLIK